MDHSRLLTLQLKKDNWQVVDCMDNWVFIYDHMPPRMKIIVDMRIQGVPKRLIAVRCQCSLKTIEKHLRKAKKRFLRGENIL